MKIKDWRLSKLLNQTEMAQKLSQHAKTLNPFWKKTLTQRTYAWWEKGVMPRNGWMPVIRSLTKQKVTADDWSTPEKSIEKSGEKAIA